MTYEKGKNLFEIKERFETYYIFLNAAFSEYQYTLAGMDVSTGHSRFCIKKGIKKYINRNT